MGRRGDQQEIELLNIPAPAVEGGNRRWMLVAGLVLAALAALLVLDRADRAEQARNANPSAEKAASPGPSPTPGGSSGQSGQAPAVETFTEDGLPPQLSGTMYAVTEGDSLVELDLSSGRGRRAQLGFAAAPWLVSQVVALEDTLLISSRRQVYSVDRATLRAQQQLASDRWVVASPTGDWAALVPFGAGGGAVTLLNGAGLALAEQPLVLPSGVEVHGAVADGLVVDHGAGLQMLRLDGVAGAELGSGRFLAAGSDVVARMSCQSLKCLVVIGPPGGATRSEISGVLPAGPWLFGPGAVFDPPQRQLSAITSRADGQLQVQVYDTSLPEPAERIGAVPPRPARGIPALAWSSDGSAMLYASEQGLVLWPLGSSGAGRAPAGDTVTVPMPGDVLSITVTPDPPPPPVGGPPPSFA